MAATISMPARFYVYAGHALPKTMDASSIIDGVRLARRLMSDGATRDERDAVVRVRARQPRFRPARVRAPAGALR